MMAFDNLASDIIADIKTGVIRSLPTIGKMIIEDVDKNFVAQGARGAIQEWPKTTISALVNRKSFPNGDFRAEQSYIANAKTLQDTGALRKSIQIAFMGEESPNNYLLAIDSSLDYAEIHEKGGVIQVEGESYPVPPRPFLWVIDNDTEGFEPILKESMK